MKILIDAHAAIQKKTGIGRYTDNLIKALPKVAGNETKITLYTHSPFPQKYQKFPSYNARFKNGIFRVFWGLNHAVSKLKPDLVHINNFAPLIKTVPIVITVHDLCFKSHSFAYPLKTLSAFKLFFGRSLKLADKIICVSNSVKKNLLNLYPVNPEKICVIYEAPDPVFKPLINARRLTRKLKSKFKIEKTYFLVVGNIEPRKKPLETIDVLLRLKKFNTQLVFVGPNLLKNAIFARYKREIASGKIRILGFVGDNDLNLLYNGAQALIYNSSCEGFGLPILEAMRCRTPVICSNIGVFREIAQEAAIFVKNEKELMETVTNLLSDQSLRQKYARLGHNRSRLFSWEKTVKETLKIYKQVLRK